MKRILSFTFLIACIFINGLYLIILFSGSEKVESKTFYVNQQKVKLADGSIDSRNFIEIKYFSNKNKNGYENFEIKFNYLMDENKTGLISQGLQYTAKSSESTIDFTPTLTRVDSEKEYYKSVKVASARYEEVYKSKVTSLGTPYTSVYNYMSDSNDYSSPLKSTNPLTSESWFKLEIGNEVYAMKLRNNNFKYSESSSTSNNYCGIEFSGETTWSVGYVGLFYPRAHSKMYENYRCYDLNYLTELLYNSVKNINNEIIAYKTIEFGNIFDYYDSNGKLVTQEKNSNLTKVINDFKSYYTIKIEVVNDGIRRAQDSLFNSFQGNMNFNTIPELNNDYYWGRALISVDMDDLDFEINSNNEYEIVLSDLFEATYIDYKNGIKLYIIIDLDYINDLNINYKGIKKDAFSNFEVFKIETIQSKNGETVRTEVQNV